MSDPMSVAAARRSRERRGDLVGDVWVVARRGLLHMRRQPEALADVTHPADHVRAAVRLRVRRRDQGARAAATASS